MALKEETKKRIRRDKKTALLAKIEIMENKAASLEKKLLDAKETIKGLKEELELLDNAELRKQQEEEQKKIAKFIKAKGVTLEQLEELLK